MRYLVTDDKTEMEKFYCDYSILSPGKYQNIYENEIFLYLNEDLVDYFIDDLFDMFIEDYDGCQYEYINEEQLNILEYELSERITEIKENKEITGNYFPEILYESLNKEIKIYKNDILKMLDDLYMFIKANKENGITILGPTSLSFLLLSSSVSSVPP